MRFDRLEESQGPTRVLDEKVQTFTLLHQTREDGSGGSNYLFFGSLRPAGFRQHDKGCTARCLRRNQCRKFREWALGREWRTSRVQVGADYAVRYRPIAR